MKKRLPFEKPMISYEPVVNHILGIIASDYNNLQYALYNNFIEITYTNSVDYYGLRDWDRLDIFYSYRYPKEIKNAMDDEELKKLLIKWIDDDNYILVSFETYYINHYPTYKYNYFRHYAMILGYDTEKKNFICADFFDFVNYEIRECKMDETIQAIRFNSKENESGIAKDFTLLKIKNNVMHELNVNGMIQSLNCLLIENNTNFKKQFGLQIFDKVCNMLKYTEFADKQHEFIRHAHFLFGHILLMKERVLFLSQIKGKWDCSDIVKELDEIIDELEVYRNYILKLNRSGKTKISIERVDRYCILLQTIKIKYQETIKELIRCLINYY